MMSKVELIARKIQVNGIVEEIFGNELHPKQCLSLGHAALGLLESESLILHRMGQGLAKARGLEKNTRPNKLIDC